MADRPPEQPGSDAAGFRARVARWRGAMHAEIRRSSSLPTAMFDATDPMLEIRLAETTEEMLALLHKPKPHVADASERHERRLEAVDAEELRALPRRIGARATAHLDLLADIGSEYVAVLADACCTMTGVARQRAATHMCNDFGIEPATARDALRELLRDALAGTGDDDGDPAPAAIERVVAEVVGLLSATPPPAEGPTP